MERQRASGGLKTAMHLAAEEAAAQAAEAAAAQAEEMMEAVMKETIRILREELRAEIKQVADTAQQLAARIGMQESLRRDVTRLSEDVKSHTESIKSLDPSAVLEQLQANQAEHKKMCSTVEALTCKCDQQLAQIQSDFVRRTDLERIKDQMEKLTQQQDSQTKLATMEHVDKQVSDLQAGLTQITVECRTYATKDHVDSQISDLRALLPQALTSQSSTPTSNRRVSFSEEVDVRQVAQELVDKKMSDMHEHLCQIKKEQEVRFSELERHGAATEALVDKQISDFRTHLSKINISLTFAEMRDDMQGMRRLLDDNAKSHKEMSELYSDLSQTARKQEASLAELRGEGSATKDHVDKEVSDLHAQLSLIKEEYKNSKILEMKGEMEQMKQQLSGFETQSSPKLSSEQTKEQVLHLQNQILEMKKQLSESNQNSKGAIPSDLEAIQEASKDHVEKKISELQIEKKSHQIEELSAEIQNIWKKLSECNLPSEFVTRSNLEALIAELNAEIQRNFKKLSECNNSSEILTRTDLDALRKSVSSELQAERGASQVHFEEKFSELHVHLSQMKDAQEVGLSELRGNGAATKYELNAQLSQIKEVKGQMHQMQTRLSECNLQPKLAAGLQVIIDRTQKQVSEMSDELQEMRTKLAGSDSKGHEEATQDESEHHVQLKHAEGLQVIIEGTQKQVSDMRDQMQGMQAKLAGHSANGDFVTRADLEAFREAKLSDSKGQEETIKDQVDNKISALHTRLSEMQAESERKAQVKHADLLQIISERTEKQVSDMRDQMQEMQTKCTGRNENADFITHTDLEAFKEATRWALLGHEEATKEHIGSKISELHTRVSEIKDESESNAQFKNSQAVQETIEHTKEQLKQVRCEIQEIQTKLAESKLNSDTDNDVEFKNSKSATLSEAPGQEESTRELVQKQISDLNSRICEIREHLAQREDESDVVTRADLEAVRDQLLGELLALQDLIQELRSSSDAFQPFMKKEMSRLSGQMATILHAKHAGPCGESQTEMSESRQCAQCLPQWAPEWVRTAPSASQEVVVSL